MLSSQELDSFIHVVCVDARLADLLGSSGKRITPGNVRSGVVGTVNVVVVQDHALVAGRLGASRRVVLGAGGSLGAGRGLAVGLGGVVGGGSGLLGSVGGSLLRPGGGPRRGPSGLLCGLLDSAGGGGGLGAVVGGVVGAGLGAVVGAGGLGLGSSPGLGAGAGAGLLLPVAPVLARGGVRRRSGGRRNVTCGDSHVLGGVDDVGLPDDFTLHERHGEGASGESGNNKSGAHVDDWLVFGLLVLFVEWVRCLLRSQILGFVD